MRATRTALILACWLSVAAPVVAVAEELPPLVRALDEASQDESAAALGALRAAPDRDVAVAGTVRDTEAFRALSERTQLALLGLVEDDEIPYANSGVRAIVRSESFALPVRDRAARVLATRGSLADVPALGDALTAVPEPAARALVAIGGRSAESTLRRKAGDDPHPAIRAALVRFGDRDELRELVERMGDDAQRDEIVRQLRWATGRELPADVAAWRAYARRLSLADQLAHEDHELAQNGARELAAVLKSRTSSTLESDLLSFIEDARWPIDARAKAALILGRGESRAARDVLLHACRRRDDVRDGVVRLYCAEALAYVGDLSCAVPLAAILVHDEDKDRIKARRENTGEYYPVDPGIVRAMLRFGCRGVLEPILELLAGEYRTRMHRDALRALSEVTRGESFGFEPDASKEDRAAAHARIRAWWEDHRATIPLEPRADDPGWDTFRADVAAEIEKLGAFKFLHQLRAKKTLAIVAEPALPQLLEALGHDVLHVRMGATEVLAIAAPPAAVGALVERLAVEENPAARSKLLVAIARCARRRPGVPTPQAAWLDAVRKVLGDDSLDVRISAARVLGEIGAADDATRLQSARDEERNALPAFRAAAGAARLALGDLGGLPDVLAELRSDDVLRRSDGAAALTQAGIDLHGYDPDADAEEREAAIERIRRVLSEERR